MRNKECLGQWGKGKAVPFSSWIFYTVRLLLFISVQLWERCLRKEFLKWGPNQDLVCNWEILVFQTPVSTAEGTEQIHSHKRINSGVRQRRNSYARTFLSSPLLPEEGQSSKYFYISSRTVQEGFVKCSQLPRGKECLSFLPDLQGSCSAYTPWRKPEQVRWWDSISLQRATRTWISPLFCWKSPWTRE